MDEAVSELSIRCNPADAGRALYLLSAPAREMNMDLVKQLGEYLKDMAGEAVIRNGDYPREKGSVEVTVVLSELSSLDRVKDYYSRATAFIQDVKTRQAEVEDKLKEIEVAAKDLPSLL
jgi:cell division GTPase FtsZ